MNKKLSQKSKSIWRLRCTLVAVLLSMITGGICVFSIVIGAIVALIWLAIYFLAVILYIPLLYRSYEFNITEEFLTVKKGIIFNKHIVVNIDKILYIEFLQSPLQKKMKICSVIVHTAGSLVVISQIDEETAFYIRSVIKNNKELSSNDIQGSEKEK